MKPWFAEGARSGAPHSLGEGDECTGAGSWDGERLDYGYTCFPVTRQHR